MRVLTLVISPNRANDGRRSTIAGRSASRCAHQLVTCSAYPGFREPMRATDRRKLLGAVVATQLLPLAEQAQAMDVIPLPPADYQCPSGPCQSKASAVLELAKGNWPVEAPFTEDDFLRYDEASDFDFYRQPRFVKHVDDAALDSLTAWYERNLPSGPGRRPCVRSWVSHFPTSLRARQVSGLGMNAEELAENPVLTDYVVKDLNKEARLPYQDNTFDAVVNTVSIDYLNKPIQIMKEVWLLSANVMYGGLLPVA
eukprot:scaffold4851_cov428-Prasinococcus_capsulatus_cf.AAC.5